MLILRKFSSKFKKLLSIYVVYLFLNSNFLEIKTKTYASYTSEELNKGMCRSTTSFKKEQSLSEQIENFFSYSRDVRIRSETAKFLKENGLKNAGDEFSITGEEIKSFDYTLEYDNDAWDDCKKEFYKSIIGIIDGKDKNLDDIWEKFLDEIWEKFKVWYDRILNCAYIIDLGTCKGCGPFASCEDRVLGIVEEIDKDGIYKEFQTTYNDFRLIHDKFMKEFSEKNISNKSLIVKTEGSSNSKNVLQYNYMFNFLQLFYKWFIKIDLDFCQLYDFKKDICFVRGKVVGNESICELSECEDLF